MQDLAIIQAQDAWVSLQAWLEDEAAHYVNAVHKGLPLAAARLHPMHDLDLYQVERMSPAGWRVLFAMTCRALGIPRCDAYAAIGSALVQPPPTSVLALAVDDDVDPKADPIAEAVEVAFADADNPYDPFTSPEDA